MATSTTSTERRTYATTAIAGAAALMLLGWLLFQGPAGRTLLSLGSSAVVIALALDQSRRTFVLAGIVIALGVLPLAVILLMSLAD